MDRGKQFDGKYQGRRADKIKAVDHMMDALRDAASNVDGYDGLEYIEFLDVLIRRIDYIGTGLKAVDLDEGK